MARVQQSIDSVTGASTLAPYTASEEAARDAEEAAAAAEQQAKQQAAQQAAAARALVVQTAQTAVGVAYGSLTAAQVRALMAVMLWQSGALAADGTVRPLAAWVRSQP